MTTNEVYLSIKLFGSNLEAIEYIDAYYRMLGELYSNVYMPIPKKML